MTVCYLITVSWHVVIRPHRLGEGIFPREKFGELSQLYALTERIPSHLHCFASSVLQAMQYAGDEIIVVWRSAAPLMP